MVQLATGAFSSDKGSTGITVTPMWDDPTVWTTDFLGKVSIQPRLAQWFQNWHDAKKDWNQARIETLTARGELPIITWAPRNPLVGTGDTTYNLASINAGNHDVYIDDWATKCAAYGKPILIRPMHEMNSAVYSWGVGVQGQTAANYIAAFQRMVTRFRAKGAYNAKWVWCPLAEGSAFTTMYPGDTYVDYLALDGYNYMASTVWTTVAQTFDTPYASITGLSAKPFIFAEVGCMETSGDKAAWITDLFNRCQTNYPRTRGVLWFDSNKVGEKDWRINSTTTSLAGWNTAVVLPENAGNLETGVQYVNSTNASLGTGSATGDVALTYPTGLLTNDILVISAGGGGILDMSLSQTGWTRFADQTDANDGVNGNSRLISWWKRVDGTEGAGQTLTLGNTTRNHNITISQWRGCITNETPIDDPQTFGADAGAGTLSGIVTLPSSTLSGVNRRVVSVAYFRDANATPLLANMAYSARFNEENEYTTTTASLNSQSLAVAHSFEPNDSAVIAPVVTLGNAQKRYVAHTFGLTPAPTFATIVSREETLRPTSTSLVTGLTPTDSASATAILADDPDTTATFMTGPAVTGVTNPIEVRVPLGNPVLNLRKTSSVNGSISVQLRKKGVVTANPTVTIELREGGVLRATLVTNQEIASQTGELLGADFDQNLIVDKTAVEIWITSAGILDAMIEPGSVEWTAEVIGPTHLLKWDANTDIDLSHYNVYRSPLKNLLTDNQATVETDTTGFATYWEATNSRDTTRSWQGSASLKVDTTGFAGDGHNDHGIYTLPSTGVAAGTQVVCSAYVWMPTGVSFQIGTRWQTAANGYLAESGVTTYTGTGAWQRVTSAVSSNATQDPYPCVEVTVPDTQGAQIFWLDGLQVEIGTSAAPWTSPSYVKVNTANITTNQYLAYATDLSTIFWYKLTATDFDGNESALSAAQATDTTPPVNPTGLTATLTTTGD